MKGEELRKEFERLNALIGYDPQSGDFTWKVSRGRMPAEAKAGTRHREGYLVIKIGKQRHYAHRIAWLLMTGSWPKEQIDHINRNSGDNRWDNLRLASPSENRRNNGNRGFSWNPSRGSWQVRITIERKDKWIGHFDCMLDARAAYLRARREHFGEFA